MPQKWGGNHVKLTCSGLRAASELQCLSPFFWKRTHPLTYTGVHVCVCIFMCLYIHIGMHIYTETCVHTHVCIHILYMKWLYGPEENYGRWHPGLSTWFLGKGWEDGVQSTMKEEQIKAWHLIILQLTIYQLQTTGRPLRTNVVRCSKTVFWVKILKIKTNNLVIQFI